MSVNTTLAGLSQTAAANGPDGASDPPSALDDSIRNALSFIAQVRDGAHVYVASVSGTNTITGNIASNPTSYTVGQVYRFVAAGANTGAVTLNFNSIGAKNLLKVGNIALTGGELNATSVYEAVYDGVNFQLVGMYGFKGNKAANGYQYLPSGILIQWGAATSSAAGSTSVSYPATFPTLGAATVITPIASGAAIASLESGSVSSFSFSVLNAAGARVASGVNWMSIGY